MKKILLSSILALSLFSSLFSAHADIIVLKDGTSITAYNIEKGEGSVYYTLSSDKEAALKKLPLSDVFALKIGDGAMQVIGTENTQSTSNNNLPEDKQSDIVIAPNNQSLIKQYNDISYTFNEKEKDKEAKSVIAIWGISPTSVLSTEEVELRFESGLWDQNKWIPVTELAKKKNMCWVNNLEVRIFIHNKTQTNLYIDLSQTVRSSRSIGYRQFYDGSVVSHGNSSSSAVGVGLGVIGIGTSSGTSQKLTESQPSTLMILPDSELELPRENYISDYDKKIYERYERLSNLKGITPFASRIGTIKQYQSVFYDYNDSPDKITYSLAFSNSPDFTSCKRLNFSFYIRQLIGLPKLWNAWKGTFEDDLRKISPLNNTSIMGSYKLEE